MEWFSTACYHKWFGLEVITLKINFKDNTSTYMGGWNQMPCVVTPGAVWDRLRCSGMHLRQELFTATAPNGEGMLYVAVKKNGVVASLPVV
jgi:hypothetical protein